MRSRRRKIMILRRMMKMMEMRMRILRQAMKG
jgi:hypothetical protein